jgi:hypothetical protein
VFKNWFIFFVLSVQSFYIEAKPETIDLVNHHKDIYSQSGEDGIIEKIFSVISPTSFYAVEIGAWDGFLYSNTANLEAKGWKRIGFEANKDRAGSCPTVVHAFVTPKNINQLLEKHHVPEDVDFISIDIDSLDFYVWASLRYMPKLVCIEHNYFWGLRDAIVPLVEDLSWDGKDYYGASTWNMYRLGQLKGYTLIYIQSTNLLFIRNDLLANSKKLFKNQGDFNRLHKDFFKNFRVPDLNPVKKVVSFDEALSSLEKLLALSIQE